MRIILIYFLDGHSFGSYAIRIRERTINSSLNVRFPYANVGRGLPPQLGDAGMVGYSVNPTILNKYTVPLSDADGGSKPPPYDIIRMSNYNLSRIFSKAKGLLYADPFYIRISFLQ